MSRVTRLHNDSHEQLHADISENEIDGLKFSQCLPTNVAAGLLAARARDTEAIKAVLAEDVPMVAVTR